MQKYDGCDFCYIDNKLLYKLLSENATPPMRGTPQSAGIDLYSAENINISPKSHKLISTDLCISLPKGCDGRIAPRSGLAVKNGIHIGAGVIDNDYTGT